MRCEGAELTLRPAAPEDAEALAALATAARRAAVPQMPPPVHTPDEDRAWIARQVAGEREAWVAEGAGRLVGYVLLEPGFLHSLYVAPDRLRQGIGTALLDLVKALRPGGFALWVFESNLRARAFYTKHGLVELEHTDGSTNEERAPDLRMAWPGTDPLAYLRAEADAVDAELAGLRARRAALAEAIRHHEAGNSAGLRRVLTGVTPASRGEPVKVEIWSDVVCPWCYIGKRRFEQALARFAHRDEVEVVWRSFELDPGARSQEGPAGPDYADRLARKYGTSRAGAQQMLDSMTAAAAAEGLDFHFERAVAANTFDAHQVIHLAEARGIQDTVKERLLRAYFTEGEPVGDRETLVRLGAEAGLEAAEVAKALEEQEYASAVRADEEEAGGLGISGVPFFVIDRRYGVSGAQPPEQILAALDRAWEAAHPGMTVLTPQAGDGDACGPDGCAI